MHSWSVAVCQTVGREVTLWESKGTEREAYIITGRLVFFSKKAVPLPANIVSVPNHLSEQNYAPIPDHHPHPCLWWFRSSLSLTRQPSFPESAVCKEVFSCTHRYAVSVPYLKCNHIDCSMEVLLHLRIGLHQKVKTLRSSMGWRCVELKSEEKLKVSETTCIEPMNKTGKRCGAL